MNRGDKLFELKNHSDIELIFRLSAALTGSGEGGQHKKDILLRNVEWRINSLGLHSLVEYLRFAESSDEEYRHLLSALTIHTTSWFREMAHYDFIERHLTKRGGGGSRIVKGLSMGCSTGEELYSLALVLEELRERKVILDYSLAGVDIDPVSIKTARDAVYRTESLSHVKELYHKHILLGTAHRDGYFTIRPEIRQRLRFHVASAERHEEWPRSAFDLIMCRNLLIYFSEEKVASIILSLCATLSSEGLLCLGHSEGIAPARFGLKSIGPMIYQKSKGSLLKSSFDFKRIGLIVIGASTGGTEVLSSLLANLPAQTPPIVIVQHITGNYARPFAERLSMISRLRLIEPSDSQLLRRGTLAMALGDYHLLIKKDPASGELRLLSSREAKVSGHRPSVDLLFKSAASLSEGRQVLALLLTGMGNDGAEGLLAIRKAGGLTVTQSRESCVVHGMPRAAEALGASSLTADPTEMREIILDIAATRISI